MKNYYADNLYYTTTAFSRCISSIAENAFMDLGLTPSDAYLIMVVNEKPNVKPTEISEKILLAPSTITPTIFPFCASNEYTLVIKKMNKNRIILCWTS